MHGTGCIGVEVAGGVTQSLTPGRSFVRNSRIENCSRWHRTYMPALSFGGVGNSFTGNHLSGGPHAAMVGGCNDCLCTCMQQLSEPCRLSHNANKELLRTVDNNTVSRFLFETADSGVSPATTCRRHLTRSSDAARCCGHTGVLRRPNLAPPWERHLQQPIRGYPAHRPAARQQRRARGGGVLR